MTRYSEVLDKQQQIVRYMLTNSGKEGLISRAMQHLDTPDINDPRLPDAVQMIGQVVGCHLHATPYWVSPEISSLIYSAAETLEEWTIDESFFPTQDGFLWFARPLRIEAYGSDQLLHGFGWIITRGYRSPNQQTSVTLVAPEDVERLEREGREYENVLAYSFYSSHAMSDHHVEPTGVSTTSFGVTLGQITKPGTGADFRVVDVDAYRRKMQVFGTTLLFMAQSLFRTVAQRPDRPTRRRYIETYRGDVPDVRVIELRRVTYDKHASDYNERHVDWACQWMVRGHWRKQYYPSIKAHRPKWIMPHWKGPEDAPVRVRKDMFAVTR